MAAITPNAAQHAGLADLASRFVDVAGLEWQQTRFPGVEMKVLLEDKETGLQTALVRMAPGARLCAAPFRARHSSRRVAVRPRDVPRRLVAAR